ncbi:unnamed protein product [Peronospora destructor]|uniref:Uncharacterized protein n=1 Tax=Peronospora destructor TaxID=86335 RepID=A0AAV0UZ01_9STRA|nr:unnamed protein product [Peronospora destructor]
MAHTGAPYDDSSSTESEYYFDLYEELEEKEAAHALVHGYDASVMQKSLIESQPRRKEDTCGLQELPVGRKRIWGDLITTKGQ